MTDKEKFEMIKKGAEQGYVEDQSHLGYCYYIGEGVAQDYEEAVKWYTAAAKQGNVYAQNNLGCCYYYGEGVEQDYKKALKWFNKAAQQRFPVAQRNKKIVKHEVKND